MEFPTVGVAGNVAVMLAVFTAVVVEAVAICKGTIGILVENHIS
jgi:hypothetical protein